MEYRFDDYVLTVEPLALARGGEVLSVKRAVLETLLLLVERGGEIVTRKDLLDTVWKGRMVSDAAIAKRIENVRRVIGDDGRSQRYIKTIYGRGFLFESVSSTNLATTAAPVTPSDSDGRAPDRAKPSLAVLPLRVVGPGSQHAHFAEALPSDIITALVRLNSVHVIARASAFQFASHSSPLEQVHAKLGVRFVAGGTLEFVGSNFAANIELAEAGTGAIIWGDRFETSLQDVHAVRGEIVDRIASAIDVEIVRFEARRLTLRAPQSLSAWEAYHKGLAAAFGRAERDVSSATKYFRHAVEQDPLFACAHAGLAQCYSLTMLDRGKNEQSLVAMRTSVQRALELDETDPFVCVSAGLAHAMDAHPGLALDFYRRAVARAPSMARAHGTLGGTLSVQGDAEEALGHCTTAIALSPIDPMLHHYQICRAAALFRMGRTDEATQIALDTTGKPTTLVVSLLIKLAIFHHAGETTHTKRIVEQLAKFGGRMPAPTLSAFAPQMDAEFLQSVTKAVRDNNLPFV